MLMHSKMTEFMLILLSLFFISRAAGGYHASIRLDDAGFDARLSAGHDDTQLTVAYTYHMMIHRFHVSMICRAMPRDLMTRALPGSVKRYLPPSLSFYMMTRPADKQCIIYVLIYIQCPATVVIR